MNSYTHSVEGPPGRRDGLDGLAADVEARAAQDLDGPPDSVRAARVLRLRGLMDRLEGQWLKELAGVDARGAAGAEDAVEAGSTAGWLRRRLRLGAGAAASSVRTARALFRGPLAATADALADGVISVAHARVLAHGTQGLSAQVTAEARRCWSRRPPGWTRPGCAGSLAICGWSPTPTASMTAPSSVMPAGGSGWPRPSRGWWQWMGCWNPRPARPCWPPWSLWPAPTMPRTPEAAANAPLMRWPSWPAAAWRGVGCRRRVGSA